MCEPHEGQEGPGESSSVVKRWRMDVLSASKGRHISRGHHAQHPETGTGTGTGAGGLRIHLDEDGG